MVKNLMQLSPPKHPGYHQEPANLGVPREVREGSWLGVGWWCHMDLLCVWGVTIRKGWSFTVRGQLDELEVIYLINNNKHFF